MSIDKIEKGDPASQSQDIVADNISKLKELFPEIVTEGKIDFTALQEILGEEVESGEEYYRFTWAGKAQARREAHKPSTGTLRPCKEESVDWDSTQNLYIEGDNLEVLKLLQKSYAGKIKMIYIDPPYNTGKDFVYKDNYKDNLKNYQEITGQVDNDGIMVSTNTDSDGRYHSNWLNMMYPRLRLARNLLKDDGIIFISIDDNELNNLQKCCNDIFGQSNFVLNIIWKKRNTPPNDQIIGTQHDYIVLFSKNNNSKVLYSKPRTEKQLSTFKNPDNHPKGRWTTGDLSANVKGGRYSQALDYEIVNPNTGQAFKSATGNWRFNQQKIELLISNNELYFGKDGKGSPKLKRFLCDVKDGVTWSSLWDFVPFNTSGSNEMKEIFGVSNIFENPKPSGVIKELLRCGS